MLLDFEGAFGGTPRRLREKLKKVMKKVVGSEVHFFVHLQTLNHIQCCCFFFTKQ
jgi:hypothetical protein